MNEVAEIDLEELWACASPEALQRIADLARKVLKAAAANISSHGSGRQIQCVSSGPNELLAFEHRGGAGTAPEASIGVPLHLSGGRTIGTLRVVDERTRTWSSEDRDLLNDLAACLTREIELKLESLQREKAEAALERTKAHLLAVADRIPGLVFERRKIDAARSRYTFFGSAKSRLPAIRKMMEDGGTGDLGFVHRDDRETVRSAILRSNLEETDLDLTFRVKDFDRRVRWLRSQSIVRRDADGAVFWDGLIFDVSDLVAAREDADLTRAARDKLLFDVDNNLRAPLRTIIDLSDVLKRERLEHVAAHASDIQLAAKSLLTIVRQLVAQAGGAPSGLESSAEVEHPVPPTERGKDPQTARVAPSPPQNRSGAHVLLADDLDLNRKLIADMLSLEGHVVDCAADGAEAVRMASQRRFDLILMDMTMPVMDGIAATKAIRALPPPSCNVPIIALTAHSMREQLDGCLKAGMNAMLTKPMSIDALNAAVDAWIGGRTKAA